METGSRNLNLEDAAFRRRMYEAGVQEFVAWLGDEDEPHNSIEALVFLGWCVQESSKRAKRALDGIQALELEVKAQVAAVKSAGAEIKQASIDIESRLAALATKNECAAIYHLLRALADAHSKTAEDHKLAQQNSVRAIGGLKGQIGARLDAAEKRQAELHKAMDANSNTLTRKLVRLAQISAASFGAAVCGGSAIAAQLVQSASHRSDLLTAGLAAGASIALIVPAALWLFANDE